MRTALITGGTQGIGLAVAKRLVALGMDVGVVGRSTKHLKGAQLKAVEVFPLDLMKNGSVQNLRKSVQKKLGEIDILVHCLGGTLDVTDPFCGSKDWDRVFRFNLGIAVELNQIFFPEMTARKWGRVVHISSISGKENLGPVPYCAAKSALNAYVRSMGRVMAKSGVVLSAVAPGAVLSETGHWARAMKQDPKRVKEYLRMNSPQGRFSNPDEIAAAVGFLVSEDATQCMGSVLELDGGVGRAFL